MPDLTYPTVDYGPLLHLVGTWSGDKGMDHSPPLRGKPKTLILKPSPLSMPVP